MILTSTELPDLAVMANFLQNKLQNLTLLDLKLHVNVRANVSEERFKELLLTHKVNAVYRDGKELRLIIGMRHLGLHLMLHGELRLVNKGEEVKFPILQLDFADHSLVLSDWQKAAAPILDPEESHVPDALAIEYSFLKDFLSRKTTDIKSVLLDQKIVRGIGNAYADEILYDAGISPRSVAHQLPNKAVERLLRSIRQVFKRAIEEISIADPDGLRTEDRDFMAVHLPKVKATAKGEEILIDKLGPRKTYYTASQILYT